MADSAKPEFWNERRAQERIPWDFGGVPMALRAFLSREKLGSVLIPSCGTGYEVRTLARAGWHVDALDFSPEAIRPAQKFLGEDARFVRQADFFAENPNGAFDLVYERIAWFWLIEKHRRTDGTLSAHSSGWRVSHDLFRTEGRNCPMKSSRHNGIASALGAALLFGASTPLAKLAVSSASAVMIAGLLYLGSGVGLAVLGMIRSVAGVRQTETPLVGKGLPWLAGAILAGGVAGPVLFLLGLLKTPASAASLLLNLEAVATGAIAWVIFRENVDKRVGAGFTFIVLGGILLSLPHEGFSVSSGSMLIGAACICWGIDNNLTRKISGSDPSQIAMWKGLFAGIVNTVLALGFGAKFPAAGVALGAATIGFFGYGLSLVLFVRALRHLGTARTGAYFSTAPFAGAALSFALGQGRLDWAFCVAGVLMLVGVWLHATERHEHPHVHEAVEHNHLHVHDNHHEHEHSPEDPHGEPHAHRHKHEQLIHSHPHYPDIDHQHKH